MLDPELRVIDISESAQKMLSANVSLRGGVIQFSDRTAHRAFRQLVSDALGTPSHCAHFGPLALGLEEGRLPLLVSAYPARAAGLSRCGARLLGVVVVLHDPHISHETAEAPLVALGLTRAEARLAALVGSGMPPASAAKALGVTLATARGTMAAVHSKLGINRQAQLVSLVTRLAH